MTLGATQLGVPAALAVALVSGTLAVAAEQPRRLLGYAAMPDGARLPYVVYLPQAEAPFPVLLTYNPYAGGGAGAAVAAEFLDQGYAVMSASLRGTGCSAGRHEFQSPTIAGDGAALVEWAAAQPWSDGNVGMFGNSYAGMTQILAAGARPPHLRAIAPGASVSTLYDDIFYPGGIFNYGQAGVWTWQIQPHSAEAGVALRLREGDRECRELRARQSPQRMFDELRVHPLYDDWWRERSVVGAAARVQVPTLLFHAWQDQQIAASAAVELFHEIHPPRRLVMANGSHSFYGQGPVQAELRRRWFERWLKHVPNGVENEPALTVLFENRKQEGVWRAGWSWSFQNWPIDEVRWRELRLTADGRLKDGDALLPVETGQRRYLYPLGIQLVGDQASFQTRPSAVGSLGYRSAPFAEDTVVLGAPEVVLYVSSERSETDLMVALHDVSPEGAVLYLQSGFLRATHRQLRASDAWGGRPRPLHDEAEPLVPGKRYELHLALYPVGHVVRRGHSLELLVLAPPSVPSTHWALAAVMAPGRNAVYHGRESPSRLLLPTLPGRRAEAEAPPCGSLEMQPCWSPSNPGVGADVPRR